MSTQENTINSNIPNIYVAYIIKFTWS